MLHQLSYRLRNKMNTYRAYTKAVEIINCDCGRSVMNIITGKFKRSYSFLILWMVFVSL